MELGELSEPQLSDWSGEAAGARLRVNFTLKLLLSQNFCNQPLMRFISFASNIGPAAAVPAGPAPAPLIKTDHLSPFRKVSAWLNRLHHYLLVDLLAQNVHAGFIWIVSFTVLCLRV